MSWPNPNEYIEAIQYPKQAFSDPELRSARVVTNRFGLPRPISGNFATVFEVQTEGGRSAVRCFLREVTNQQERYAAISAHLKQHALPFMVNFEYLPEGIKVRGKWYPILKMDWANGARLDTYIEAYLDDAQRLQRLAEHWIDVCRALQAAQIAHGDLQHGNILVTEEGAIKLLDYDDMIVPDVIGLSSREIGHRHYQHPTRRTEHAISLKNFDRIDNFSSHVIAVSLLALSLDPTLWAQTKAGDENLLFRDVDYAEPDKSASLQLLIKHGNPQVRNLGQVMVEAVRVESYLEVKPLAQNPLESRFRRGRSWLFNQLLDRIAPPLPEAPTAPAVPADSWVFDHLQHNQPPQIFFSDEFLAQEQTRLAREFDQSFLNPVKALYYPYLLIMLALHFPTYTPVIEKAQQEAICRDLDNQLLEAVSRRKTLSKLIVEADRHHQQELGNLEMEIAQISGELQYLLKKEARERTHVERILFEKTQELLRRQNDAGQRELSPEGIPEDVPEFADLTHDSDEMPSISGWDDLVRWRKRLDQGASLNGAIPVSVEDLDSVRQHYAEIQLSLERQQRQAQLQLEALKTDSESVFIVNSLRQELEENEKEISALKRQQMWAAENLRRYERVTRLHLIWFMLKSLLINKLRDSV